MNRTTLSLIAAATALAAVTGFAVVSAPGGGTTEATAGARTPARMPVERSSLLCPAPSASDLAETAYTSFTPAGKGDADASAGAGSADLVATDATLAAPDDGKDKDKGEGEKDAEGSKGRDKAPGKPVLSLKEPGKPVTAEANTAEAPALVGSAEGRLAPGWTAQQTTKVTAGQGRGVLGVSCTAPDTSFWFAGASTAKDRQDYVHLTNPDDTAAVADIELFGEDGALESDAGEGITVPARSSVPVLLSTLGADSAEDLTVHVTTRTGRVGAVVQAVDEQGGSDWLAASAEAAGAAVLPGVPKDATSVRLVVFAPGEDDADLNVRLAGPTGSITPAGHETLHVKAGMTTAVDLEDVTKGEPGSLLLSPVSKGRATPVVAALRVVRGKGAAQEVAYIPATGQVGGRATVADNRAKGSTLSLTAPGAAAEVRVTASAGSGGGEPVVETYKVKAGTTLAVKPPVPSGLKGSYALTVEPRSGGPVHASRMLELPEDGVPMFTVQTMPDDRGTVSVPEAEQDLSVLDD
ncbi:hypothetical protein AR457_21260 [Streptomyces agglomeratus]|uniref:Secreted protein n=1 Tax=Streptomyces agglomeratus TaxID=285458 RepID=A0A1E5PAM9_9ACTN|nr:DUF5719 family protein [Streptomyces agglomeratus]OEJ26603.1 hypothetical protein AS594_21010 [Streptomyces agglomeratus]OEJ39329.1 hypothetical protein BGK70_15395 [Streptomyces agglomeratus]OEJ46287.1 hypothetical protein AR457_21260 [Streptomyces agglomeratus]OEJ51848.1 hypothetical protein BGK72_14835 [Streptomyces agglomeratus]OEJ59256.1 hypothetical protein BGM19_15950 [Streptomyces agglomeratus]